MAHDTQGRNKTDRNVAGGMRDARDTRISTAFGSTFAEFDWSYVVDLLPVSNSWGWTDEGLRKHLPLAFAEIEALQQGRIYFVWVREFSATAWRHPHILLGGISRLVPDDIRKLFRSFGFTARVDLWDRARESGYAFKTFDFSSDPDWDTNVNWASRQCRNEMSLCRKHLLSRMSTFASANH